MCATTPHPPLVSAANPLASPVDALDRFALPRRSAGMRQNRELDYVLLYVGVPRELHKGREIRPGIVQVQRCRYSPVFVATESGLSAGTTNVTVHMENVVSAVLSAGRYVGLFPPIHSSRVRKRRELRRVTRGFWCRLPRIEAFRSGSYS